MQSLATLCLFVPHGAHHLEAMIGAQVDINYDQYSTSLAILNSLALPMTWDFAPQSEGARPADSLSRSLFEV